MHAYTLLHARPHVAPCTPIRCSMHAHTLPHARPLIAPRMPIRCYMHAQSCSRGTPHAQHPSPSPLPNQSEQRVIGSASSSQRKLTHREPSRRSFSPDRPPRAHASDRSANKNPDFPTGTSGRVFSACAVCLGRHPHKIIDCSATTIWDKSVPTLALRSNKILSLRDGRPICADWQRSAGCSSSRHDNRHLCSGCCSPSHGAQDCPRAQKASSANSL